MRLREFFIFLVLISEISLVLSQDSSNMRMLYHTTHFEYTSSCWGYEAEGREFGIYGWLNGTSFVDITDENNISEIAFLPGLSSGWREMKVYGNYLYIVSEAEHSGIQIADLSYLPDSVHLVNTFFYDGFSRAHTISQFSHYLYVNGGNYRSGGIVILDIGKDPENPVKLGEWEEDYVHDCRIVNDTIWACNPLSGKVSVISCLNKNMPRTITSWINGQYPVPHNCAITVDSKYLYVCDENFSNPGKLKIWDISNKEDIIFVRNWSVSGTAESVHNVEIFGNYAFLAYYGEGVRVLDITDPVAPVEIAWYKTTGCWQSYYFSSGKIIASDIYDGFYVFVTESPIRVNNLSTRKVNRGSLQNYPNPFNPATHIGFRIAEFGLIRIVVYDALGREVQALLNQELNPGIYEVDFDGSNLPSGVYYYKIESGSFIETKKMVLLK